MTEPGDTVFVVVTESDGHPPKIGVFASVKGAGDYINAEIDRFLPTYATWFTDDPGPEFVEDRQAWWNRQMCEIPGDQIFISFHSEIVED